MNRFLLLAFSLLFTSLSFACDHGGCSASCPGIVGIPIDQFTFVPLSRDVEIGVDRSAEFIVNYNGFTPEAQAAFQYAVDIWAAVLVSSQPIEVDANWEDIEGNVLGFAGATSFYRDEPGLPVGNTWYPVGLANHLANIDLNGGDAEITATFDSGTNWYFGTDGNTPGGLFDFVSVVLHELGHGLGVLGSAQYNGVTASIGIDAQNRPIIYDTFVENGSNQPITSFSGSAALLAQYTSNNLFFDGPQAVAAEGGDEPKLFAPSEWSQGSSYSHWDEFTYQAGNVNSLMTPQIGQAEAIHDPGPITLGLLEDIGWSITDVGGDECLPVALVLNNADCNDQDEDGVLQPVINLTFQILGNCAAQDLCVSVGGAEECFDLPELGLVVENGDGIIYQNLLFDEEYTFFFTTIDGSSSSFSITTPATCEDVEPTTICDCNGTVHTIGVLDWLGDGFQDDGDYEWEEQTVDFNCATWGYDCGDIVGSPDEDPFGVCQGNLPPNNGCGIDGCVFGPTAPFLDYCYQGLTSLSITFDFEGDCTVESLCTQPQGGDLICTTLNQDFVSGETTGLINVPAGPTFVSYILSDGSVSPATLITIEECVAEIYCDCAGTEHEEGALTWLGDGFADIGNFTWDGQPVDFNCETWGYDCGDIDGVPSDDPFGVCDGNFPPENGCIEIEDCQPAELILAFGGCNDNDGDGIQEPYLDINFFMDGDCLVEDICIQENGGDFDCIDLQGIDLNISSGEGIIYQDLAFSTSYSFYFTTQDGTSGIANINTPASCEGDDCEDPVVSYNAFCIEGNGEGFFVEVNVNNLGNGAPYTLSNSQDGDTDTIDDTGVYVAGPFDNASNVTIALTSVPLSTCSTQSGVLTEDCFVSVDEEQEIALSVFPNPWSHQLSITGALEGEVKLTLSDVAGRQVAELSTVWVQGKVLWDGLDALPKGQYILQIETATGAHTFHRVVKG